MGMTAYRAPRTHAFGLCTAVMLAVLAACASDAIEPAPATSQDAAVDLPSDVDAGPTRTALPIVLLHGMIGFDHIGPLDYFYGVVDALQADGYTVFVTQVDPLQSIEVRAGELGPQIDSILAETGAHRVHLIGHSQGGLDARYLISSLGYGDRVASLTTISTPHRGSRVADVALGLLPGPAEDALSFLADSVAGLLVGSEQDLQTQSYQLTEDYAIHSFEPSNPDDPKVSYYSVAGVTHILAALSEDVCDPLLVAGYEILAPYGDNDGLVSVESATHGRMLGTIAADHLDEVGQLLGTTSLSFDHLQFYRDLARFLTDANAPAPL